MADLLVLILELASRIINIYTFIVLASVIFSWLVAFGVVNPYNPTVRSIYQAIATLTEPPLRLIRRYMPDLGAIDISPIVLLLACWFLIEFIQSWLIPRVAALGI